MFPPMAQRLSPALRAVSDAVLAVAAQEGVQDVLQALVERARELAGRRYAALGIPDGDGGFASFLVAGMSDELVASMGPLPRTHGLLGAMLESAEPFRTADIRRDPRFAAGGPTAIPDMRSFLGVPITGPDGVIAAFYLTDKVEGEAFADDDLEIIELLAAHAAIAITNARLAERSRELSILSERNRLALELHDVVSQKLFSLTLTAEAAGTLLHRDVAAAGEQLARTQRLAREALAELRGLIFELRPPDLARDGLAGTLRKHVELLAELQPAALDLEVLGAPAAPGARDREVLRIAQEALHNAVRHAAAGRIEVRLAQREDGGLRLTVRDDGIGFDPADPGLRSRRLGLTSMQERAASLGGRLDLVSAPGAGTRVELEVGGG
jgi:signal transduction histidine kinase